MGIDVDTQCNVYKFLSDLILDEKSMVRKYFLNNVSEAAVITRSGNPFHKDTDKMEVIITHEVCKGQKS